MAVVAIGLDHHESPLELLGSVALTGDRLTYGLELLMKSDHICEAAILSTCMRTEIYVDVLRFHAALDDVSQTLAALSSMPVAALRPFLYEAYGEGAYRHIFRVAAGLESAILGETEVLGQISRSWQTARKHGASRIILDAMFRRAIAAGRRARSETSFSKGITSIGQATAVMAEQCLGGFTNKKVLVVGAGAMSEAMAMSVSCASKGGSVFIANRTPERAKAVAQKVGAAQIDFSRVTNFLQETDLVLTATGSTDAVFKTQDVKLAMDIRDQKPLVIVDTAVPRDVEEEVGLLPGVKVLTLDDLRKFTSTAKADRAAVVETVEQIIDEEVADFIADSNARLVSPVVAALHSHVEQLRLSELKRHSSRLRGLDEAQYEAVNALTKAILAKVLHQPTMNLKGAAGTSEGERLSEALRLLFEI